MDLLETALKRVKSSHTLQAESELVWKRTVNVRGGQSYSSARSWFVQVRGTYRNEDSKQQHRRKDSGQLRDAKKRLFDTSRERKLQ